MFGWGITFSCVFLVPDDVLSTELQGEVCNETEASIFRYDLIEDWEKGNWNNVMEAVGLQKMEQERNLMNEESFTKVWGTRFSRAMRGIGRTFTSNEKSLVDDEIEDTSSEKGDVDDPDHEKCVPKFVVVKTKTLVIYWSVLYWGSFFGTWLIFPLLISYVDMADFHFSERLSGAIKENILIYSALGFIATVAAIVLKIRNSLSFDDLKGVAIALSNASGLLILVMLLGFGLIKVPEKIWRKASRKIMIKRCRYKAITLFDKMEEASKTLDATVKLVKQAATEIHERHPYRPYINQIVELCVPYGFDQLRVGDGTPEVSTYDEVVALHHKVRTDVRERVCTEVYYKQHLRKTIELEDILLASSSAFESSTTESVTEEPTPPRPSFSSSYVRLRTKSVSDEEIFRSSRSSPSSTEDENGEEDDIVLPNNNLGFFSRSIRWSLESPRTYCLAPVVNFLEYYWYVYLVPLLFRGTAIVCGVVTVITIWSEATFWTVKLGGIDVSIFSIFLKMTRHSYGAQLLILAPLTYMAFCSFYSLFKLRVFNLYRVRRHQQTDDRSLLFSAAWLARLIPPLSYNFLLILHEYNHTAFAKVMSSMDVMGEDKMEWFNVVMSFFLLVLSAAAFFNVHGKIMELLQIRRFQFAESFHDEQIDQGALHVQHAKKKLIRELRGNGEGTGQREEKERSTENLPRFQRPQFSTPDRRSPFEVEMEELVLDDDDDGRDGHDGGGRDKSEDQTKKGYLEKVSSAMTSLRSMWSSTDGEDSPPPEVERPKPRRVVSKNYQDTLKKYNRSVSEPQLSGSVEADLDFEI
eukprot:CAMPEP_0201478460 /NCGR_PEP_ID=MMETSP0151_2-20130828/3291_1 /ASSEMBLY_ACC=CAM_ASM_000257 /TAXON_ID=200890 /ORGANISM="Paramoeba atlantica, Strain 621/1 / CCAP 1560/9" /LENGTH=806 /DNA_ID=CAMNT_0047859541 /DNA_START=229 /DNA_END=2649 /DNA_ORIENTATION=-